MCWRGESAAEARLWALWAEVWVEVWAWRWWRRSLGGAYGFGTVWALWVVVLYIV